MSSELFLESEFGAQLTPITFHNVKFNLGQKIFCAKYLIELKSLEGDMNDMGFKCSE